MYSYGPPHMVEQKQDNQLEHAYSSYVRIRNVALRICRRQWTIGRSGERGSGIPVLAARHDDDDDDDYFPISWRDKEAYTIRNGISSKVNIIAWLKFKLTYSDVTLQHVNQYTIMIPPNKNTNSRFNCHNNFWYESNKVKKNLHFLNSILKVTLSVRLTILARATNM